MSLYTEQALIVSMIWILYGLGLSFEEILGKLIAATLLYAIGMIYNTEMDTIRNKPLKAWYQDYWWIKSTIEGRTWLYKYPLFMFWDGWHWCKSVFVMCFLCTSGIFTDIFYLPFVLFIGLGIIWNYYYDY